MPVLLIVLLNVTVNYLLLLAAAGFCRCAPAFPRTLLGAAAGGVHILLCLLPGLGFLKHTLWHILMIPVMGFVAFGKRRLRLQGTLFVLWIALDAVVSSTGIKGILVGLCVLFLLWVLRNRTSGGLVPVLLQFRGRKLRLTALQDTGNCLRDPITGDAVLVIGPEAAEALTGLTPSQLKAPLLSIGLLPGARLIPYKTVGNTGFLLGLRLPKVQIGSWQGSHVVAFAPEGLEGNMGFEALIGGQV